MKVKLPGVLSFARCMIITDAPFFNLFQDKEETVLPVIRHGIIGTQNVSSGKEKNVGNPQTTETAKTDVDAIGFSTNMVIKFTPLHQALFACSSSGENGVICTEDMRNMFKTFVDKASAGDGLDEVARRYARNILNGRWLWRNKTLANSIEVDVIDCSDGSVIATSNALDVSLRHFDNYSLDEMSLGKVIAQNLRGNASTALKITAKVKFGFSGAVEVFPSQNYVDKPKGFARPLYKLGHPEALNYDKTPENLETTRIMGQAALRDQKIGNAIRTIDTWYKDPTGVNTPIPVEPNGANLDAMKFFRNDDEQSAFAMMKNLEDISPDSPEGMFMIAAMIRGGVYSEGESSEKKEEDKRKRELKDAEKKAERDRQKAEKSQKKADKLAADNKVLTKDPATETESTGDQMGFPNLEDDHEAGA